MKNAIIKPFSHRETGFDDIVAFSSEFTKDITRQNRWNSFIKKKRALIKIDFDTVIKRLEKFLMPIVDAIELNKEFNRNWDKERRVWVNKKYD